jgi:hypothetical protein
MVISVTTKPIEHTRFSRTCFASFTEVGAFQRQNTSRYTAEVLLERTASGDDEL